MNSRRLACQEVKRLKFILTCKDTREYRCLSSPLALSSPCRPSPERRCVWPPSPKPGATRAVPPCWTRWHAANVTDRPAIAAVPGWGDRSRVAPWPLRAPCPGGIDAARWFAASSGTGRGSATTARSNERDERIESGLAKTTGSEEVTFTIVAGLSLSIDDIDRLAQDRWDATFSGSRCSKRTTQQNLVNSSPVPDDHQSRAFQFRGYAKRDHAGPHVCGGVDCG